MSELDIPETWAETEVAGVCVVNPRNVNVSDDTEVTFVPMAAVDEITGSILSPQIKKWSEVKKGFTHFQEGDVILAKITPCMENRKFAIARNLRNELGAGSTEFHVVRPPLGLVSDFLWSFFRQDTFVRNAERNMTGSAGQKRVPTDHIKHTKIPLPPTGEQKRIVDKIKSTSKKIEVIEQSVEQAEKLLGKYRESLLAKAFRGELVPQNPNDEPASKLLERIRTERAKQQEGKKKKKDDLPPITEEEIPFEIPNSWEWVRLEELTVLITKGSSPKWQGFEYQDSASSKTTLFVTSENVGSYKVDLTKSKYLPAKFNEEQPRSMLKHGDFLMNIVGGSIGRCARWENEQVANINQAVCLIRPNLHAIDSDWMLFFLNSPLCLSYMHDQKVDNARANLSMGNISTFLVPLPPMQEQVRIASKISNLLEHGDKLLSQIEQATNALCKARGAILECAFSGTLTEQRPSEGTGHDLLKEILAAQPQTPKAEAKTKAKSTATGKRKKK